jgi:hypothetical protein
MILPVQVASSIRYREAARSVAGSGGIHPSEHGAPCPTPNFACGCTGSSTVVCCTPGQTCRCDSYGEPSCQDVA